MFGISGWLAKNRAKRLLNFADGLVQVAQLITCICVMRHLEAAYPNTGKESIAQRASAWANFLFGKEPSEQHHYMDLVAEHQSAIDWLEDEGKNLQDVVVQGLRISVTVSHSRTGEIEGRYLPLLSKWGSKYPDTPKLEAYSANLHITMWGELKSDDRDSVFRYIKTGPYAAYFKESKSFGW